MVRAGRLTTKAIVEHQTEPADPFINAQGEWAEVCQVFIGLQPLSGRELYAAQQVQAQTTHKATLHYRDDVTAQMRLRIPKPGLPDHDPDNDEHWRTFHIESVINVNEANRELELSLVEAKGG